MASVYSTKLEPIPHNAESFLGFERAQFRDFQFNGAPVEIYAIESDAGADIDLDTGFDRVFGGYVMKQSDGDVTTATMSISATNASRVTLTGLAAAKYIAVVFGEKVFVGL